MKRRSNRAIIESISLTSRSREFLGWVGVVHGVIDTAKIREGFGSRRLRGFRIP